MGYTSGSDIVCGLCTVRNLINNEHGKVHPWCGNNEGEFHLLVKIFCMTYELHNNEMLNNGAIMREVMSVSDGC
jgi:hypothetical protein